MRTVETWTVGSWGTLEPSRARLCAWRLEHEVTTVAVCPTNSELLATAGEEKHWVVAQL